MLSKVLTLCILGVVDLVLVFHMVWGDNGLINYSELCREYERAEQRLSELDAANAALSRDIRLLRTDDQYVEQVIRQQFHYLRENEILYLFGETSVDLPGTGPAAR